MPDYFHLELIRTLANDDVGLLAKTIPARFFSRVACGALALLLAAGAGRAQPLESLAQAFHLQRTPANQAALERFAAATRRTRRRPGPARAGRRRNGNRGAPPML